MPSSNRDEQETWLIEKFLESKLPSPELFKKEYLEDFANEYPEEPNCLPFDIFVIAESFSHFRYSSLSQYYKYLAMLPQDIRGRADCTLVLLGRYWRRKDWSDEVLDYCHKHNIEVIRQSLTGVKIPERPTQVKNTHY